MSEVPHYHTPFLPGFSHHSRAAFVSHRECLTPFLPPAAPPPPLAYCKRATQKTLDHGPKSQLLKPTYHTENAGSQYGMRHGRISVLVLNPAP